MLVLGAVIGGLALVLVLLASGANRQPTLPSEVAPALEPAGAPAPPLPEAAVGQPAGSQAQPSGPTGQRMDLGSGLTATIDEFKSGQNDSGQGSTLTFVATVQNTGNKIIVPRFDFALPQENDGKGALNKFYQDGVLTVTLAKLGWPSPIITTHPGDEVQGVVTIFIEGAMESPAPDFFFVAGEGTRIPVSAFWSGSFNPQDGAEYESGADSSGESNGGQAPPLTQEQLTNGSLPPGK